MKDRFVAFTTTYIGRLFIIDLILRVIFLVLTDNNFFGDAAARLEFSTFESKQLHLNPQGDWLPLPFWVQGLMIRFTGDTVFSPRIIGVLLTSLSLVPYFKILNHFFSKEVSKLCTLMFTLCTPILFTANNTLSEPYYFFFGLWLMNFALVSEFKTKRDFCLLALCAISICLVRLEGWGLCLFVGLVFLLKKNYLQFIVIGIFSLGAAIYWELVTYLKFGHFFRALKFSDLEVKGIHGIVDIDLLHSIYVSFMGFSYLTWVFGFVGAFVIFRNPKWRMYGVLVYPPIGIALFKLVNKSLYPEFRYFIFYAVQLFPLTVMAVLWLRDKIKLKMSYPKLTILVPYAIVFILAFGDLTWLKKHFYLPSHLKVPSGIDRIVDFVKNEAKPGVHFFLDHDHTWDRNQVMAYGRIRKRENVKACLVDSHEWLGRVFTVERFRRCVKRYHPIYLLLFPEGKMTKLLMENPKELDGFIQEPILEERGYRVIKLTHKK